MSDLRRSERKRTQTQFLGATETVARDAGRTQAVQGIARRARAAAIAAAYEPLVGLVQLGEAGGGEGRIWVGEDSPALGGFAPTPADRQRFLQLVQQFRDANAVRGGASVGAVGWGGLPAVPGLRGRCAAQPREAPALAVPLVRQAFLREERETKKAPLQAYAAAMAARATQRAQARRAEDVELGGRAAGKRGRGEDDDEDEDGEEADGASEEAEEDGAGGDEEDDEDDDEEDDDDEEEEEEGVARRGGAAAAKRARRAEPEEEEEEDGGEGDLLADYVPRWARAWVDRGCGCGRAVSGLRVERAGRVVSVRAALQAPSTAVNRPPLGPAATRMTRRSSTATTAASRSRARRPTTTRTRAGRLPPARRQGRRAGGAAGELRGVAKAAAGTAGLGAGAAALGGGAGSMGAAVAARAAVAVVAAGVAGAVVAAGAAVTAEGAAEGGDGSSLASGGHAGLVLADVQGSTGARWDETGGVPRGSHGA
jgi:hypothetical protein